MIFLSTRPQELKENWIFGESEVGIIINPFFMRVVLMSLSNNEALKFCAFVVYLIWICKYLIYKKLKIFIYFVFMLLKLCL